MRYIAWHSAFHLGLTDYDVDTFKFSGHGYVDHLLPAAAALLNELVHSLRRRCII